LLGDELTDVVVLKLVFGLVGVDEIREAACDGGGFGQTSSLVLVNVGLLREPNLRLSRVTG
jgi:hypothetical protein